jgi:hypothetical protein
LSAGGESSSLSRAWRHGLTASPSFLENSGYFRTPEDLVFSRRIVDPEFGGRVTGKLCRWNFGLPGIDDRAPGKTGDRANSTEGHHPPRFVPQVNLRQVEQFANPRFHPRSKVLLSRGLKLEMLPGFVSSGDFREVSEPESADPSFGAALANRRAKSRCARDLV